MRLVSSLASIDVIQALRLKPNRIGPRRCHIIGHSIF
jgi:hypothetical protein